MEKSRCPSVEGIASSAALSALSVMNLANSTANIQRERESERARKREKEREREGGAEREICACGAIQ